MSSVISPFERDFSKVIGGLVDRYIELRDPAGQLLNGADIALEQTGYDNWNGGTYSYDVICRVRRELYWRLEDQIPVIVSKILDDLGPLIRPYRYAQLQNVLIIPALADAEDLEESAKERRLALEEPKFWRPGYFRLFISHLSADKVFAQQLSEELLGYGISGFVAHEDIEPTRAWEDEIRKALRTMEGLLAILSPGFNESVWTDQEVGAAIGRDKPVLTLRNDFNPYGFMASGQALKTKGLHLAVAAREIGSTLLAREDCSRSLAEGIVTSFVESDSFAEAKFRVKSLVRLDKISEDQRQRIEKALVQNSQVRNANYVVPEATSFLKRVLTLK